MINNSHNGHDNEKRDGCPSLEILRQVAKGQASSADEALVESHLNQCSTCTRRFDDVLHAAEGLADVRAPPSARIRRQIWRPSRLPASLAFPKAEVSNNEEWS